MVAVAAKGTAEAMEYAVLLWELVNSAVHSTYHKMCISAAGGIPSLVTVANCVRKAKIRSSCAVVDGIKIPTVRWRLLPPEAFRLW